MSKRANNKQRQAKQLKKQTSRNNQRKTKYANMGYSPKRKGERGPNSPFVRDQEDY